MTEGNGHVIDPAGEARQALQAAVAEHGPQVLSNPVMMDGICRDRLTGLPGESILIDSAARSDVPTLLQQRTASLRIDDAIQSVAATVAAAHGLDTAACVWVVSEFARALGYPLPGGFPPVAGTVPAGFTDQGDALPPGPAEPSATAAAAGGTAAGGAAASGATGPPPSRTRGSSRSVLGAAAAVALVVIYLAVAAAAHLSPFTGTQVSSSSPPSADLGSSPNGSPDVAADASPDVSPDPAPDPAPDPDPDPDANTLNASLLSLIPGDIQSGNTCSSYGTRLGSVAAIECSGVQGLSAGTFYYYLFANVSALNQGYSSFLQDASFPYSCSASDGGFASFITSCQSHYSNNSPVISGTISEYLNSNNYPVIACTDDQQLVMVVMVGANGGDLLAFWNNLGWIVTSG
jgi:hypothetical protein